jgi:exoribonuclease II
VKHVLFEEAGKFNAGRVMSQADSSMQVELDSGKRVKIKTVQAVLHFDQPTPLVLMAQAQADAAGLDLDLAWEFAPQTDFGFVDLAHDYFGAGASLQQQAAALYALHGAPHYFRRLGKGQFRKASAETVQAALAGIEKKRLVALQVQGWADDLVAQRCPDAIASQIYKILFKPDKNAPEYRAVVDAAKRSQRAPLVLLREAGAIGNAYQFHWRRFLFERFAGGIEHAPIAPPALSASALAELPLASAQAFSIDDSTTTEIDDALSVQGLGSAVVTVGIHIAAPGLAIAPGSPADLAALQRLSTVYVPGFKVTMLPPAVVEAFTLDEGGPVPALSLYVECDAATLDIRSHTTRLERVPIVRNLRHDQLDAIVTDETLAQPEQATFEFAPELAFLHRLARHLKTKRETVRGKPETFNRPDPVFKLRSAIGVGGPSGEEAIDIGFRQRGAALDLIVAEAMILANSTWGTWMASLGVPAIYRSQASMAPGIKVRMGTKPLPHAGMGVANYAWSTSPLRRYVDLVNQWQLIACVRHGQTAALAAPFKPRDASLMAVVSAFDAAYTDYATVQRIMERYWMMRWIKQEGMTEMAATVMQAGAVRAESVPLVMQVAGTENLPRGSRVQVRLSTMDEVSLEVHAALVARLDAPTHGGPSPSASEGDEDDDQAASPLVLAIDVSDAHEDAGTVSGTDHPPVPTTPASPPIA